MEFSMPCDTLPTNTSRGLIDGSGSWLGSRQTTRVCRFVSTQGLRRRRRSPSKPIKRIALHHLEIPETHDFEPARGDVELDLP